METITLTRVTSTHYTFTKQNGDLTADLTKSSDNGQYGQGTWMWAVDACGKPIDTGSADFRTARATVIATLEMIAPAFAD